MPYPHIPKFWGGFSKPQNFQVWELKRTSLTAAAAAAEFRAKEDVESLVGVVKLGSADRCGSTKVADLVTFEVEVTASQAGRKPTYEWQKESRF